MVNRIIIRSSGEPSDIKMAIPLHHFTEQKAVMFFIWIELWLKVHCRDVWSLHLVDNPLELQVSFHETEEALLFKLCPEYDLMIPHMAQYIAKWWGLE